MLAYLILAFHTVYRLEWQFQLIVANLYSLIASQQRKYKKKKQSIKYEIMITASSPPNWHWRHTVVIFQGQ
jgi:hypothetical protein